MDIGIWLIVGIFGQIVFSTRFLVQWFYSEIKKSSIFPLAFWFMSIIGGATLLCYAIHKRDPVFILAQSGGLLIYLRNLQWRLRERRENATHSQPH